MYHEDLQGFDTTFSETAVMKNGLYGDLLLDPSLFGLAPSNTAVSPENARPSMPEFTPSPFHAAFVTRAIS